MAADSPCPPPLSLASSALATPPPPPATRLRQKPAIIGFLPCMPNRHKKPGTLLLDASFTFCPEPCASDEQNIPKTKRRGGGGRRGVYSVRAWPLSYGHSDKPSHPYYLVPGFHQEEQKGDAPCVQQSSQGRGNYLKNENENENEK